MRNMGYCRFQNTLEDLQDCYNNMNELPASDESNNAVKERRSRSKLVRLCKKITDDYYEEYWE